MAYYTPADYLRVLEVSREAAKITPPRRTLSVVTMETD